MKVKRKVSEFKEKKAEKSSFLQTIFCFVNHHFKQTVHFKLCDLHWLYDKGGNLWYKLDCYGSLYRIIEYDSTYKICTWYQKGYEREITQDGFIFFIVTREHNDI